MKKRLLPLLFLLVLILSIALPACGDGNLTPTSTPSPDATSAPSATATATQTSSGTPTYPPGTFFTVTYHTNGGKNHVDNWSEFPNSSNFPITLKNPTLSGHTFKGWYTDENFNVPVTQITSAVNTIVYAKWTNDSNGRVLQWRDSFLGNKLNAAYWTCQSDYGAEEGFSWSNAWGNYEAQYYTNKNIVVNNGLTIFAEKDTSYGMNFTSARIMTRNKVEAQPGSRIEARIKLPTGNKLWPAFWMLPVPTNSSGTKLNEYGIWPHSGEIDIMEARGDLTQKTTGAIHCSDSSGNWYYRDVNQTTYSINTWRTYAVEWTTTGIKWFVDDTQIGSYTNSQWSSSGALSNPYAPFDKSFYILLNLAIAGPQSDYHNYPPSGPASWTGKKNMEVEYVAIYKL